MVQECVDSYRVEDLAGGAVRITIEIPARFRDLWLARLSELRASDSELAAFRPPLRLE